MDCKNARLLLEFTRPGGTDLEPADAEALEQHLADCPDCGPLARDERRADEHLGRAVRDVPIPAGLRERILQKLPPDPVPWHRRWWWRGLGAAAALFVVAGLGLLAYQTWFAPLPAVDLNAIHTMANNQPFSDKEEVRKGFLAMGVETVPPPRFNYNLLDSYGLVVLEKKQLDSYGLAVLGRKQVVPQLLFLSRDERTNRTIYARVYILSREQFDLRKTRKNEVTVPSGTHSVKLDGDNSDDPPYLYLIIYTGDSLNPFLRDLGRG